ncbi:MAG: hypothetical protein LWX11_12105, partial [Firmicutes bacterium]|nr:hypothetical protein [Bacillota bacterium]
MKRLGFALFLVAGALSPALLTAQPSVATAPSRSSALEAELVAKYGEAQRSRIQRGLKQVSL